MWFLVCAFVGCGVVLGIDAVASADYRGAVAIWDKIVDRIMDNDVPKSSTKKRTRKPAPKQAAPAAAPKTPRPTSRTSGGVVGDKPSSRADVAPMSPDAYAKGLTVPQRNGAKDRADLNALIDNATR